MPLQVDYLPVATGTGNNADSQANFAGSTYQQQGFVTGLAQPNQVNKICRQASMMAAALANFISSTLNINVLDDGNLTSLISNLTSALATAASGGAGYSLGASGYVTLPSWLGGWTVQWVQGTGIAGTAANTTTARKQTINWPIAFPTACLWANVTTNLASVTVSSNGMFKTYGSASSWGSSITVVLAILGSYGDDGTICTPFCIGIGH